MLNLRQGRFFPSAKCGGLDNTKQNKRVDTPTVHLVSYKKQRSVLNKRAYMSSDEFFILSSAMRKSHVSYSLCLYTWLKFFDYRSKKSAAQVHLKQLPIV